MSTLLKWLHATSLASNDQREWIGSPRRCNIMINLRLSRDETSMLLIKISTGITHVFNLGPISGYHVFPLPHIVSQPGKVSTGFVSEDCGLPYPSRTKTSASGSKVLLPNIELT